MTEAVIVFACQGFAGILLCVKLQTLALATLCRVELAQDVAAMKGTNAVLRKQKNSALKQAPYMSCFHLFLVHILWRVILKYIISK